MNPNSKGLPLVLLLHGLSQHYKKDYCYPSQITLSRLLHERQGVKISIATLNRWLSAAEGAGLIFRQRRIVNRGGYGYQFQTTLYKIALRGYVLLNSVGHKCYPQIRRIISGAARKVRGPRPPVDESIPGGREISFSEFMSRYEPAMVPV